MPAYENYPLETPPDFIWGNIEAYASAISVKQTESISFHVWTNESTGFTIEIFRKGLTDTLLHSDTGQAEPYPTEPEPWINGCGCR